MVWHNSCANNKTRCMAQMVWVIRFNPRGMYVFGQYGQQNQVRHGDKLKNGPNEALGKQKIIHVKLSPQDLNIRP